MWMIPRSGGRLLGHYWWLDLLCRMSILPGCAWSRATLIKLVWFKIVINELEEQPYRLGVVFNWPGYKPSSSHIHDYLDRLFMWPLDLYPPPPVNNLHPNAWEGVWEGGCGGACVNVLVGGVSVYIFCVGVSVFVRVCVHMCACTCVLASMYVYVCTSMCVGRWVLYMYV
jgi:hypothetical protein